MNKAAGVLLLLIAWVSLPALAADYSAWLTDDEPEAICQAEALPQQQQQQPQAYPGRYCCVHCRANEVACGGKCLPQQPNGKKAFCKGPPGCACPGKP